MLEKGNGKTIHLLEWILPYIVLLAPYKFGIISLDTICLGIVALLTLLRNSWKMKILPSCKPFIYFCLYALIRDLLKIFLGPDSFQTQINRMTEYMVVLILAIIVIDNAFSEETLYKSWKFAGTIFTLGLVYHIIQLYIFGTNIKPISIIPGYSLGVDVLYSRTRPCSFFSEPATFVTAMMPLECLAIKRNDYKWAILSTLAVLASTSTVGIVLSTIVWAYSIISHQAKRMNQIVTIVVAAVILALFLNLNVFSDSYSKLLIVANGGSTFTSRIVVGYEIVKSQSLLSLVFGTNYNIAISYVRDNLNRLSTNQAYSVYYYGDNLYLNTIAATIFRYGLIGLGLLLNPLLKALRTKQFNFKIYIVMILFDFFGQIMLLGGSFFQMMIIISLYMNQVSKD